MKFIIECGITERFLFFNLFKIMSEIKTEYPSSQIENPYIPKNELEKQRAEMIQKMVGDTRRNQ